MKYVPSFARFRYPIGGCLLVLTGFFVAPEIIAQELTPSIRPSGMDSGIGVIMDTTMFSTGTRVAVQVTLENGVKKTRAEENGIKTYIEELVEGGIRMKVTRQYGPDDRDLLMEKYPDLYMSAKDFPTTTEGAEAVEVTIGVTQKIEVAAVDELKLKYPDAYQSYLKYTQSNNGMRILRGRFGDAILTPEIRIDTDLDGESVRVVPQKTEGRQPAKPPESPVEVKDPAAPQTDKPAGKDHKSK